MDGFAPDPHHVLDEIVVLADRRRRSHHALATLVRVAPRASAILVVASAIGLATTGSLQFGWFLWLAVAAAAATFVLSARRARPATDTMAAQVDEDARLEGELRSGHWFARRTASHVDLGAGAWTEFHVERAVARARDVAWDVVYPPVRGRQAASLVAISAAVMLALPLASGPLQRLGRWVGDHATLRFASGAGAAAGVRPWLDRMLGGRDDVGGAEPPSEALAEADRQWALANEAARRANRNAQDRIAPMNGDPPMRVDKGEVAKVDLKSTIEASVDAAAGGTGLGGLQNLQTPTGRGEVEAEYSADEARPQLIAALSREVLTSAVDADDLGEAAQDGRRQTERGQSALAFSGALARTTFDAEHATAPAPVPEHRRPFLARYFTRVTPSGDAQP